MPGKFHDNLCGTRHRLKYPIVKLFANIIFPHEPMISTYSLILCMISVAKNDALHHSHKN